MKYVIIGAGAAGVAAAETIRETDPEGQVTVLGDERFFPYNRFMLTDFLSGAIDEDELIYSSAQYFSDIDVKLRKGELVKSIHPERKTLKLFHNEVVHYDKLLIATGGNPGLGPVLQPFKRNIQRYYTLRDAHMLKRRMVDLQSCIVFGGGLSSLDLLRGLLELGKKVTYIFKEAQPDWALAEPELNDELLKRLKEKGVEVVAEDRIISINKDNGGFQVETLTQKKLTADVVFAWDFYKPNLALIKGTGMQKKLGILVDEQLKTSIEDIYAAGDCVEIYHPGIKNYWINFGWPNAQEQGVIAGKNMAGLNETYKIQETLVFNLMGQPLRARWWK